MTRVSSISPLTLDCSFCRTTIATENTETPHDLLTRAINVNKGTVDLCVLFGKQPYRSISHGPTVQTNPLQATSSCVGKGCCSQDRRPHSPGPQGQSGDVPSAPGAACAASRVSSHPCTSHTASGHHPSGTHLYCISESVVVE